MWGAGGLQDDGMLSPASGDKSEGEQWVEQADGDEACPQSAWCCSDVAPPLVVR